jgi:hypothetical protein
MGSPERRNAQDTSADTGMQKWNKELRPETAAASRKQEGI